MCLLLCRLRATALDTGFTIGQLHDCSLTALIPMVAVVATSVTLATVQAFRENLFMFLSVPVPVAEDWAQANTWRVINLQVDKQEVLITAIGPPPKLAPELLRKAFDEAGLSEIDLTIKLIVGDTKHIPGTRSDSEVDE